jgi:hypothetical protein
VCFAYPTHRGTSRSNTRMRKAEGVAQDVHGALDCC